MKYNMKCISNIYNMPLQTTNIFIKSEYFFEKNESMCGISHDEIVETSLMMS